jgi:hypothetical protein
MTMITSRFREFLHRLRTDDAGSITIEFAFALSALTVLVVGIVNMGLAYSAQMNLSNAVRAGSQFALVRHPSLDPNANLQQAIVSMQDIRDAVVHSSNFLAADPGAPDLTVCVFYECPSLPPTACTASPGSAPGCSEWQTFVTINLSHLYQFLIPFPGFASGVTLSAGHTVRLN